MAAVPAGDGASARPGSVPVGRISRPHGLLGAVVLHTDPSLQPLFVRGLALECVRRDSSRLATRVRSAAPVRGGMRLTLDDVRDRNASEALVGAEVFAAREDLGLEDDDVLDIELLGLEVLTADGARLGRIVEVIPTGANDVYVVQDDAGTETLVPAVSHAVLAIDLDAGRMTVAAEALEYSGAAPAEVHVDEAAGAADGGRQQDVATVSRQDTEASHREEDEA